MPYFSKMNSTIPQQQTNSRLIQVQILFLFLNGQQILMDLAVWKQHGVELIAERSHDPGLTHRNWRLQERLQGKLQSWEKLETDFKQRAR